MTLDASRTGTHDKSQTLPVQVGAEDKLAQLDAALKPSVIHLGLPTFGQIAGRFRTS
ncbi:hypothetical protein U2F26_02895 [Micromonospora sp. 4G57]|uniref:FXSXX-COOH protein n=1 Tax=Micromonospora sicca TaxID=2202420 RepID=A0ABU5JCC7_9ACTN|nr:MULTISPECIES: hypothetical protein [unclassified Micromonospora]MDZ5441678.1 hypothetical protein [Micromonospora sp. 4G57]MDZ5490239.1 hypothetical protein [Micromonospora sp. 4G53]